MEFLLKATSKGKEIVRGEGLKLSLFVDGIILNMETEILYQSLLEIIVTKSYKVQK